MTSGPNPFPKFLSYEKFRSEMQLPPTIVQELQFQQYFIRKEYNNPLLSNKSSINTTTERFNAFSTLSKIEMIELYMGKLHALQGIMKNRVPECPKTAPQPVEFYLKTNASTTWKRTFLRIVPKNLVFEIEKRDVKKVHALSSYICRRFQCTDYFTFTMEAVSSSVKRKYTTLYLGFTKADVYEEVLEEMKKAIEYATALNYARKLNMELPAAVLAKLVEQESRYQKNSSPPNSPTRTFEPSSPSKSNKMTPVKQPLPFAIKQADLVESQIVSRIMEQSVLLKDIDEEHQAMKPVNPMIIQQILPDYKLENLQSQQGMNTILCKSNYRIVQHRTNKKHFKMFISVESRNQDVFNTLTNMEQIRKWNSQVETINVKNVIKSENSAVMYMKLKNYSKTYRGRDFLYLRHAFNTVDTIYIVDKSIENLSYPPFMTIVRGDYSAVFGLIQSKEKKETLIIIDIQMDHSGIVNEEQNTNLTMRYLQEFGNIKTYLQSKGVEKGQGSANLFDIGWTIKVKQNQNKRKVSFEEMVIGNQPIRSQQLIGNELDLKRSSATTRHKFPKSMKEIEQSPPKDLFPKEGEKEYVLEVFEVERPPSILKNSHKLDQQPSVQSIEIQINPRKHPKSKQSSIIEEKQDLSVLAKARTNYWIPPLDGEGMSIINWNCLKHKFKLSPWFRPLIIDEDYPHHHIFRGEWKHDDELGGLFYKDEEKMNAQKKVLGYIIKKMGSNLFSGKGITSISLPVDVFSTESNLERVARMFTYAPLLLEEASKLDIASEQMKNVIIASITNSLLYMSMEKPFNPVLGQTFQGSINGCPIFLEQVSHHPPIASYYMVGRGYKIYGSIESKMNIGMNSGTGINDGDNIVQFDNGNIIKYRTPGGEISGLTFGDRKLNLVGKAYYWSPNKHLMLQLTYNPNKKGFFSVGKQETPSDYFSGTICKVTKEYIEKFEREKNKPTLSKKDILEEFSHVEGIWTGDIIIDGKVVFNADKQKFIKFEYEPNSLPSDANYREDVVYRRLGNIVRSQIEKERIQDRQRKDRKLREKVHGKKH